MTVTWKKEILEEKPATAPLCSPKIPYGQACDETRGLYPGHVVFHVAEDTCRTIILPQPRLWLLRDRRTN